MNPTRSVPWITVGVVSSLLLACDQPVQESVAAQASPAACTEVNGKPSVAQQNRQRIINVVATQLGVKPEDVRGDSAFVDDLGADSLDFVEVVMALEDEFGITI